MKDKIVKLLDVKSIVTLVMTIVLAASFDDKKPGINIQAAQGPSGC